MLRISFSPQRRDDALTLEKNSGDRLRINGELFNFNTMNDGDVIPFGVVPCDWIVGPVEKIDGEVRLTVVLPIGPNPSHGLAFPEPVTGTYDGPIIVPYDRREVEEVEVPGGKKLVTTYQPWGGAIETTEVFIADEVEPADVEP